MDIHDYFRPEEKPLETLASDGGFAGVFRTVGCIGDSLSSGEFQAIGIHGENTYHDMFDYSWGQYLARMAGIRVYNFSRGGMSAKEYMESFAEKNGFWEKGADAQAFILALGVNDVSQILSGELEMGSIDDVDLSCTWGSKHTFIGYYASIIQRIVSKQPDVHFFLMTIPRGTEDPERTALYDRHAELLYQLAEIMPRTWVMDFRKYAPVYDEYFREKFFMAGHMNPAGYLLTGKMVASYMDYIVRHNMEHFCQLGFTGTVFSHPDYIK